MHSSEVIWIIIHKKIVWKNLINGQILFFYSTISKYWSFGLLIKYFTIWLFEFDFLIHISSIYFLNLFLLDSFWDWRSLCNSASWKYDLDCCWYKEMNQSFHSDINLFRLHFHFLGFHSRLEGLAIFPACSKMNVWQLNAITLHASKNKSV